MQITLHGGYDPPYGNLYIIVGCCALTTPKLHMHKILFHLFQAIGVVVGQHPTDILTYEIKKFTQPST